MTADPRTRAPVTDDDVYQRVRGHLSNHDSYRRRTLNLTASENVVSKAVSALLNNDLVGRYANYRGRDRRDRIYPGTEHLDKIEEIVDLQLREAFGAVFAEPRPLSGHIAGLASLRAALRPGDSVLELDLADGGHGEALAMAHLAFDTVQVHPLAFDPMAFTVDADRAIEQIAALRPRVVLLGSSNFLIPHPVEPIAAAARQAGSLIYYDGSHVMGLIAAGRFQEPLAEGADVIFGSTHKTMPGPQGGVVVGRDYDLGDRIANVLDDLQTNYHPHRMPALATALEELRQFGPDYADATVDAARFLAAELAELGVEVVRAGAVFTASHTLLVATRTHGPADELVARLEAVGIMTTAGRLPEAWGGEGIRLGSQELVRRGATGEDIRVAARLVADTIEGRRDTSAIGSEVRTLAEGLGEVSFSLDAKGSA